MIILYSRSSSVSNWTMCQQQYYITYNLGYTSPGNKKSNQGSAVHKVLEQLAIGKKYLQDNPNAKKILIDGYEFDTKDFLKESVLSDSVVDSINRSRINKNVYLYDCKIPYGQKRYGMDIVEFLLDKSCKYYSAKTEGDWTRISFTECTNWTWIALDYKGGIYDPRRRTIVQPEQHFSIEIDKPWAKYSYELPNGEKMEGNYEIKGTVDLTTELSSDTMEVCDWKGLPIDTPIPTADGWKSMGELKVGDILFDEDGNMTNVIGKSKVNNKKCFKITFDDTTTAICDIDHLWKLSNGNVVNILDLKRGDSIRIVKSINVSEVSNKLLIDDIKNLSIGLSYSHIDNLSIGKIRTIDNIVDIGNLTTQCIMVDSPSHTFLCTKNMIPTHNTGQRKDWATGEVKTYTKLCEDTQLMIYYYALSKLYPQYETIFITIFFIRDGGPFTIGFERSHMDIVEERLEKHFNEVKNCEAPKLCSVDQSDFKCTKLCHYYKTKKEGSSKNICSFIRDEVREKGVLQTIVEHKAEGFVHNYYESPGE